MLASDRSDSNNYRLLGNWRPVWVNLFKEFPNTQFVLHHNHDHMKIPKLDNVRVEVYKGKMTKLQERSDPSDMTK
jgi:hypothetical protein